MKWLSTQVITRGAWRCAAQCLALAFLAATSHAYAHAPVPGHPTLLRAVNALRQQGCDAGDTRAAPLRENAALSHAAMLIAGGSKLDDALKTADYRAVRAAQVTVRGITGPAVLARKTLGKSCAAILMRELSEAGFHQRGNQTWVVLAAPFSAPAASQADDVQARILALVNAARAQPRRCGNDAFNAVPPLRLDASLTDVAAGHAADMAQHSYFSHTGRDGSTVGGRATRDGYRWRSIGENIAAGQMNADAVVQGWLRSPGHCANIMAPAHEEMGTAFVVNTRSTMGIYWVQVFGTGR